MALAIRRRPFTHRYDLLSDFFDRDWLGQPLAPGSTNDTTWVPPVDIEETKDAVIVRASIPGYSADEMSVSHVDGVLLIEGARETSGGTSSETGNPAGNPYKPNGKQASPLGCTVRDNLCDGTTSRTNTVERKTL